MRCANCGEALPDGAFACPSCGHHVVATAQPMSARTILGGVGQADLQAAAMAARAAVQAEAAARQPKNQTLVGMPTEDLRAAIQAASISDAEGGPRTGGAAHTLLGLPPAKILGGTPPRTREPDVSSTLLQGTPALRVGYTEMPSPHEPSRTLMGIARPGIAPLSPGVVSDASEASDEPPPSSELGATLGAVAQPNRNRRLDVRIGHVQRGAEVRRPKKAPPKSNRVIIIGAAAGSLAVLAGLVALLWKSAPPVEARPRADAQGNEGVELRCESCPDGTIATIDGKEATFSGLSALVPLTTALSVGDNKLRVGIKRPAGGRAEDLHLVVHVGYRIRPDLGTLQGDHPAIAIDVEAAKGTEVSLGADGGEPVPLKLVDGRASPRIEVSDALSAIPDETKVLTRRIPYVVTPEGGAPEKGTVDVSVPIVPLHIDAPGPRITTDQPTFVLAGHTSKGAEVLAAGRPIAVKPDGSFAQIMNVSSVGATQIEVRAKLAGMAPRLVPIRVRRVASLETAAREFASEAPLDYQPLATDAKASLGKPVALAGEVLEARRQGYQTIAVLDVARSSGCEGSCTVRLVIGGDSTLKKGDKIRAFGRVGAPFVAQGREVPEIAVEFIAGGLS